MRKKFGQQLVIFSGSFAQLKFVWQDCLKIWAWSEIEIVSCCHNIFDWEIFENRPASELPPSFPSSMQRSSDLVSSWAPGMPSECQSWLGYAWCGLQLCPDWKVVAGISNVPIPIGLVPQKGPHRKLWYSQASYFPIGLAFQNLTPPSLPPVTFFPTGLLQF